MGRAPGQPFGQYMLFKKLGVGGMGEVWFAIDNNANPPRQVALKLLFDIPQDQTLSIYHEIDSMKRLDHENVCRLYKHGIEEGTAYLALELLEGGTWPTTSGITAARSHQTRPFPCSRTSCSGSPTPTSGR